MASSRLNDVRMVFLDMDGTIYHGGTLFPTTLPFLEFLRKRGIGYAFLSNNSSYSTEEYVAKLAKMGIATTPRNFYTSTSYTIDFLKRNHPEINRIHLFGMPCIRPEFEAAGFELDDETPQAVIVAFHRAFDYDDLCRTAWLLRQGIPGFATHPDLYCPTDQPTWLPDCGAITRCLEASTNTVLKVLGKPDPGMLREAAKRYDVPVMQCLMAGDRLSTDIALGKNAGAVTCHIRQPGADLIVPENIQPDFQVNNLGELQRIWEHV